ncbi:MAG: ABC transporter permease [Pseudomonadota bacterium]
MIAFAVRRLLQAVAVLFAVAFAAFCMFQFMGDPVEGMLGQEATALQRQELIDRLGLDDPAPVQFVRFIGNALSGDFGLSYRLGRPVSELIMERLPATLELATVSALIAMALGVGLGVFTAINRGGTLANVVMTVSLIGVSLPTFLIGILLIYVFAVVLGWLPSFGRGETADWIGWRSNLITLDGWRAILLPAITLGLYQMTLIMRLVRAEMLEVLRQDYIRFARARGLTERAINFSHALKNTLVPVITVAGLQFGSIIAFAIVTESVFQWPGVGLLFITSVNFVDVPVMAAYLLLVGAIFVVINLVVDMLYFAIDPRLRVERGGAGH